VNIFADYGIFEARAVHELFIEISLARDDLPGCRERRGAPLDWLGRIGLSSDGVGNNGRPINSFKAKVEFLNGSRSPHPHKFVIAQWFKSIHRETMKNRLWLSYLFKKRARLARAINGPSVFSISELIDAPSLSVRPFSELHLAFSFVCSPFVSTFSLPKSFCQGFYSDPEASGG
jgi:hypothetical protein